MEWWIYLRYDAPGRPNVTEKELGTNQSRVDSGEDCQVLTFRYRYDIHHYLTKRLPHSRGCPLLASDTTFAIANALLSYLS